MINKSLYNLLTDIYLLINNFYFSGDKSMYAFSYNLLNIIQSKYFILSMSLHQQHININIMFYKVKIFTFFLGALFILQFLYLLFKYYIL